jgi:hypothetical protein
VHPYVCHDNCQNLKHLFTSLPRAMTDQKAVQVQAL